MTLHRSTCIPAPEFSHRETKEPVPPQGTLERLLLRTEQTGWSVVYQKCRRTDTRHFNTCNPLGSGNFFSYDHWKELDSRGVKLLVRIKSTMILKPIERLPDGSCLAKIYPSSYDRDKDRKGIVVRVIEYTLDDPLRTGHGETHRLLTNLLDHMMFPAMELICLYHERWEEEQVYDEQKTHQDPRRPTKPAHFRSQTPEGVEQEIYALSLAHFVVRALMLEAAKQENQDADRLSFTGCFQILQGRLPECQSSTPTELEQWYRLLLEEMAQERTEPRRNRINPRVVKRKMSKFAKKRPAHRGQPTPTKTFAQSVVIT
jgi:hypothetical protein